MRRVALFCVLACGIWAQTPEEIVRRSVELDATNAQRLKNYAFLERQEQRTFDKNGKLKSTESETSEILILSGRPYGRKVARNDKPLSEKDAQQERRKLDKEADKRQRESSSDKAKQEKDDAEERKFLRRVPDAFNFKLLGVEQVGGKPAWAIDAQPKPSFQPRDSREKVLAKVRGKLWIDQADYQWVKAEMQVLDTLSFGLGLVRIAPGGILRFEQMRVNDEVWVPSTIFVHADARLGYVKTMHGEIEVKYSDYRKFQTDSHLIEQ